MIVNNIFSRILFGKFYLTISSAIQKNPSNPAVRLLAQFLSDSRIPLRY